MLTFDDNIRKRQITANYLGVQGLSRSNSELCNYTEIQNISLTLASKRDIFLV